MSKAEIAVSKFNDGFCCSQAIFSTYCTELGLEQNLGLKIAGAFGGGISYTGETCGAVTGAIMLIGLKHGRVKADDLNSKEHVKALVNEFLEKFKSRNEYLKCKELLKFDFSKPEENEIIHSQGLTRILCPKFINDAAEIIELIL